MKNTFRFITLFMLVTLLAACAPQAVSPEVAPIAKRDSSQGAGSAPSTTTYRAADGKTSNAPTDRIVIKNADLSIVVENPFAAMEAITRLSSEMGGYVVNSRTYKITTDSGVEVPEADITIRVLSEKLDDALDRIRKLVKDTGKDIRSESVTGQDITLEYIDLKSRQSNLEQTEKQLLRIQETATKTDDVLNVLTRLNDIRQQIESIKGQIKYYDESSKLSAVHVQLVAAAGISPITIGGWEPVGVARDALQALVYFGKFLVNALIWIVIFFVPIFLVFGLPGRWLYRKLRKKSAQPKAPLPPAGTPPVQM